MAKLEMTKMTIENMIFWPFATGLFFFLFAVWAQDWQIKSYVYYFYFWLL